MSESETKSGGSRISEVEKWLASRFADAGKEVPDFEYTPRSVGYLYNLLTISEAKEKSADIVAKDFRRKAAEYRSQGLAPSFILYFVYFLFFILSCKNHTVDGVCYGGWGQ
jgi:hypothetical protein